LPDRGGPETGATALISPIPDPDAATTQPAATWRALVAPYLVPSPARALLQLITTALPFLAVMTGMLIALHYGILAGMALFPVGAFLLVRLFIIQHDCGHGSFFKSNWANGAWRRCRPIHSGVATMRCIMPPPAISTDVAAAT
jgi:fatty acid desaturase